MNEELDQIEKNGTSRLVPRPKDKNVIDTKWVYRNKLNEYGVDSGWLSLMSTLEESPIAQRFG